MKWTLIAYFLLVGNTGGQPNNVTKTERFEGYDSAADCNVAKDVVTAFTKRTAVCVPVPPRTSYLTPQ